jgi:hypothetical protein
MHELRVKLPVADLYSASSEVKTTVNFDGPEGFLATGADHNSMNLTMRKRRPTSGRGTNYDKK